MNIGIKYGGRVATTEDVEFINRLIERNPSDSRRALSQEVCRQWNWVQPNGQLRDMVCRGYMLMLHRAGYIRLPEKKMTPRNSIVERRKPPLIEVDSSPLRRSLNAVKPLDIRQVRRSPLEKLYNSLVDQWHYLGYRHPIGEHLKYIMFAENRPVACMSFSSAPRHIGCRDRFIGWSAEVRQANLHLMVYNNRFLILPWVKIPNLASHILAEMVKIISVDWFGVYHHPLYLIETFVDTERFGGTCYKAANWIYLGKTTGRGKASQSHKPNRSIKAVYGYPLTRDFRQQLCGGGA